MKGYAASGIWTETALRSFLHSAVLIGAKTAASRLYGLWSHGTLSPSRPPAIRTGTTREVTDLLSWAETFDEANAETKHMIIARLAERVEINHDYKVEIKFRIRVEQYMGIAA